MKQIAIFSINFFMALKLVSCPLFSQEITLHKLQTGWSDYEKQSSRFHYEIVQYRDGTIDETGKVIRNNEMYLRTSLGSNSSNTSIFGKNDIYVFKILKRTDSGQLILESALPLGEYYDNHVSRQYVRDKMLTPPELEIFFGLSVKHIFSDGWARINKIELSSDSSKVIIEFELDKDDQPFNINRAKLKNGRAILRNDRFFLPERVEFIPSTGSDNNTSNSVILTNQFVETDQIPRLSRQMLAYSDGLLIDRQINYRENNFSQRDFTLSAFGFPEPQFSRRTVFSRRAIFLGLAVIIIGLFIWIFLSKRQKF